MTENSSIKIETKQRELADLKHKITELEGEIADEIAAQPWSAVGFYGVYYATTGFMIGTFAAAISLMVNMIGAPVAGKSPLELIRIFLTFPLGEKALQLSEKGTQVYAVSDGVILAIGCCLYLGTGMLLGVPFQMLLGRYANDSLFKRIVISSILALGVWLLVFFGILSWLQPYLFGGNWITDPAVLPGWVAACTHLVFGWSMAFLYPLGRYIPFETESE